MSVANQLLDVIYEATSKEPEYCLARKMVTRQDRVALKVLIKWKNQPEDEATWEFLYDLQKKFPEFNLVDKVF